MRQTVFEETTDGITIDRVIRDYEYTMPTKHLHDEYEIYYLLEGKRLYFIGQNTYLIGKGTMVFINRILLAQFPEREQRMREQLLCEPEQHIALILRRVESLL